MAILGGVKLLSCWSLALVFFGFVLGQFCWFPGCTALEGNFQFLKPEFSLKQKNPPNVKVQRYFHLEQPACLGFNNVRKGLTKQQTNSGIKIALKCSCSLSSFAGSCFLVSSFFPCRFTKNLSPDKINLSTLKGQGQLTNLELDEEVLQNVLELPTWLAITRVYCNKASIRVS